MSDEQKQKIKAMSLGSMARKYRVDNRVLFDLVQLHDHLKIDFDLYTKNVVHKSKKILPVSLVEKIYNTLGCP